MKGWKKVKFGELIEDKTSFSLKKGEKYSHIPMENVIEGNRKPSIIDSKEFRGSGSRFKDHDTLFARITPCLQNRKIAYASNLKDGIGFGSTEFFIFRAKKTMTDSKFLYYLSNLPDLRRTAELSMTGASGRQRANLQAVKDYEIQVPVDRNDHIIIANTISAYDDLIENNQKRIEILEEMAHRLYTEWFVKFNFPGHENVKMVDSGTEFGEIPEGWKIKNLEDISDILFGFNFKSKKFNDEPVGNKVVRIRDILSGDTSTFSEETVDEKYLIEYLDLLIGMDGIFHMNIWFTDNCYLNQRVSRIRSKLPSLYLKFAIKNQLNFLQKVIRGSTVGHLSNGDIRSFEVIVPNDEVLLDPFKANLDEVGNLYLQNQNLTEIRDLLIENLITGKRLLKSQL